MTGSIDNMFAQLSLASDPWATTIAGFVLVLIIVFGAIAVFGRSKQQLDGYGIMIVTFLGIVLATVLGLFPAYVVLIAVILPLVAILIKLIFGGSE